MSKRSHAGAERWLREVAPEEIVIRDEQDLDDERAVKDMVEDMKMEAKAPAYLPHRMRQSICKKSHKELVDWAIKREETRQEIRKALIIAMQELKAYRECVDYYLGPHQLTETRKASNRVKPKFRVDPGPHRGRRVRELEAQYQQLCEALGVLHRFIPTERGQELLAAVQRLELGVDPVRLAAAQLAEDFRNGKERLVETHPLCVVCRLPLIGRRRDAKTCSIRCRMARRNRKKTGQRLVSVLGDG